MKKNFIALGATLAAIFTLTNCTEEIQTNLPQEEGTPYTIIANAADTKTVNDGLNTKWAAEDALTVFHAPAGTTTYSGNSQFTISDVENGAFTTSALQGTPTASNDWYVLYPYNEDLTTPVSSTEGYTAVGSQSGKTQIQTGNDSKAHIGGANYPMWGVAKAVEGSDMPNVTMTHLSSLVEVVVKNTTEEDLKVETISLSADEYLIGTYYIDFTGETPVFTASSSSYGTIYASKEAKLEVKDATPLANGESAKFYLAVKPFTAAVGSKLTLTVNGLPKEKDITADVTFAPGKIKTLNFTYDQAPEPAIAAGKYLIVAGDKNGFYALSSLKEGTSSRLNFNILEDFDPEAAVYMATDNNIVWDIQLNGSNFSIQNVGNSKYLSNNGAKNTAETSDAIFALKIQKLSDGVKYNIISVSNQARILAKNSNSLGFAFYEGTQINSLYIVPFAEDTRAQLETPDVTAAVVEGTPNSITVSWEAVANATGYEVSYDGLAEPISTNQLSYTFEGLTHSTSYKFSVVAKGDITLYKPSEAGLFTASTDAAPAGQEVVVYSTGFESSEGFASSTSYTSTQTTGSEAKQWKTYYGTATTTGAISGSQSIQMRVYKDDNELGYTQTEFDMAYVTKVTYKAYAYNGIKLDTYYSTDSGANWVKVDSEKVLTDATSNTSAGSYEFIVSETGEFEKVRIKFAISSSTQATSTLRLSIDDVTVYGISK